MSPTNVSVVGNVSRAPELRFTPSGLALATFGVAVNNRKKEGDKWVDGDPEFYDVTCWRELAENVAECIDKGARVVVVGRLSFRQWEAADGSKRSKVEIVAEEVGPSLRWATAQVVRNERSDGGYSTAEAVYDPAEEPFHVDAADWMPGAYGAYPERMLP